ncbi:MAG: WD40 repeat domain-containing protein [Trebonia sp.]
MSGTVMKSRADLESEGDRLGAEFGLGPRTGAWMVKRMSPRSAPGLIVLIVVVGGGLELPFILAGFGSAISAVVDVDLIVLAVLRWADLESLTLTVGSGYEGDFLSSCVPRDRAGRAVTAGHAFAGITEIATAAERLLAPASSPDSCAGTTPASRSPSGASPSARTASRTRARRRRHPSAAPVGTGALWATAAATSRCGTSRPARGTLTDPGQVPQLGPPSGPSGVLSLSFAGHGSLLAAADANGNAYLWDTGGQSLVTTLSGDDPVTAVALNPAGTLVAGGTSGGETYLWDVPTQQRVAVLRGYGSAVTAVASSPNGAEVTAGHKSVIAVWEITEQSQG